jgi:Fur family transcriptional regulator, iron response regulator
MVRTADAVARLEAAGIQPSAQRVAVARYVLSTDDHPSADEVFAKVKGDASGPVLSRATVYNTLNLFVSKGLLRQHVLAEGRVVFDPKTDRHHHFVDEKTGAITDIPWDAIDVKNVEQLQGFDVREFQVVLRGRKKRGA